MKKQFKFDYDLSGLATWTKENADEMLLQDVLGLTLPRYASVRGNIRGTEKVGFLTNNLVFQDGKNCGFTSTGDTIVDQVLIETTTEKVNMEVCPYTLYDYYLSQAMRANNFQEEVPFETALIQDISNRVANHMEVALWQNSKAGGADFDGVLALVTTGNGATSITYTAMTSANGVDVAAAYAAALPSNVVHRTDLVLYLSYSDYQNLIQAMRASSQLNLFSFDDGGAQAGAEWSVFIPGTRILCVPTQGLDGQSKCVLGASSYYQVGFNSVDENGMSIRGFYDMGEDVVKIIARTTYGLGIFDIPSFVIAE